MTADVSIQPFRIEIPQADLDDLADRLARTRWLCRWSRRRAHGAGERDRGT
jgi:hypothetical protein